MAKVPEQGTIYEVGPYSRIASGAIIQGQWVKETANEREVEECDTLGEAAYGVALTDQADGEEVSILRGGIVGFGVAGAAIGTPGTDLAVNTAGRVIPAVATNVVIGTALTVAAADGDLVAVELSMAERVA